MPTAKRRFIAFLSCCALLMGTMLHAVEPEALPGIGLVPVSTTVGSPIAVCCAPGDTTRLYVIDRSSSKILVVDRATGVNSVYLAPQDVQNGGEAGVLGLAFHPQFSSNGYLYVNVTTPRSSPPVPSEAPNTEIRRYTAFGTPVTAASANPASRTLILSHPHDNTYHCAGWLGFGPDGMLYASIGDGYRAPYAQDLTNLRGKILRLDVDHPTGGQAYGIPTGNPYAGHATYRPEIWHYGLRNPWRCSFDRLTGDLWIGDVGESAREEIDFASAGVSNLNFGWPGREGRIAGSGGYASGVNPVDPLRDFTHSENRCIIGGYVYRGTQIPWLSGRYLFSEFYGSYQVLPPAGPLRESGPVTKLDGVFGTGKGAVSFGEDESGEMYCCNSDGLFRIESRFAITTVSPAMFVSKLVRVVLTAAGGQRPYTWSLVSGSLPTGLSLSATGVLAGMPTIPQSITANIKVVDAVGNSAVKAFAFTVQQPPTLTMLPAHQVALFTVGKFASLSFSINNAEGAPTIEVVGGALPDGIVVSNWWDGGFLNGIPTRQASSSSATLRVRDNNGQVSETFSELRWYAIPDGVVGSAYDFRVPLVGSPASPVTFRITEGTLPLGVSLSTDGRLTGSPLVVGAYSFTLTTSTDAVGASPHNAQLVVVVREAPPAGTSSSSAPNQAFFAGGGGSSSGACGATNALGLVVAGLGLLVLRRRYSSSRASR